MKFKTPLLSGKLIKRYKRFFADIILDDGTEITAHCANSGAMLQVKEPGLKVWVSKSNNPNRQLAYTWELVEVDGTLVGVNTQWPNLLAAEAITEGIILELQGYETLRREVKFGANSRVDLVLSSPNRPLCYVEVKNVHLKYGTQARFPDAVTTRGAKHLEELIAVKQQGYRAVMLYILQRNDCDHFDFAKDIDPYYASKALCAKDAGVEILSYKCEVKYDGIKVAKAVRNDYFKDGL